MKEAKILSILVLVFGLFLTDLSNADDPSLVGWWKLDETSGNTAFDSSVNGKNGTLYGGPQRIAGKMNGALKFDVVDDYVSLPIGSLISTLRSCTLSIWVNFSNIGGSWQRIFDFGTGINVYMFLSPRIYGEMAGPMRFAITTHSNSYESVLDAPSPLASGWHHVAVIIDSVSRNMKLYLDGAVVGSSTTQTLPAALAIRPRTGLEGRNTRLMRTLTDCWTNFTSITEFYLWERLFTSQLGLIAC